MAGVPGYPPDRLFTQLLNTGLQQKDPQLYQLILLMIQQLLKLTQVTAGIDPNTPSGGTTVINNLIQQLILDSGSGGDGGDVIPGPPGVPGEDGENGMVPYYIAPTETFNVPIYKQALFSMNIDNEGILDIDGFLIEVDDDAYAMQDGNNAFTGQNSFDNFPIDLLFGQIKFPATQNPSSDPNTLDDYEWGEYTPIDVSGAGLVLSFAFGGYVLVGALAFFWAQVGFPITIDGSDAAISLPVPNGINNGAAAVGFNDNVNPLICTVVGSSSQIAYLSSSSSVNQTNAQMSGTNILVAGFFARVP